MEVDEEASRDPDDGITTSSSYSFSLSSSFHLYCLLIFFLLPSHLFFKVESMDVDHDATRDPDDLLFPLLHPFSSSSFFIMVIKLFFSVLLLCSFSLLLLFQVNQWKWMRRPVVIQMMGIITSSSSPFSLLCLLFSFMFPPIPRCVFR